MTSVMSSPAALTSGRVGCPPGQLLEAPVLEPSCPDTVRPQHGGQRHPPLRQPADVLLGGRRDAYPLDVDAVLQDVQHGGDVLTDAGVEQGQALTIGAQLGDLPDDQVVDVGGQLGATWREGAGDVRYLFRDRWTHQVHPRMVCPARHGEDSFLGGSMRPSRRRGSCARTGTGARFVSTAQWRHDVVAITSPPCQPLPQPRCRTNGHAGIREGHASQTSARRSTTRSSPPPSPSPRPGWPKPDSAGATSSRS